LLFRCPVSVILLSHMFYFFYQLLPLEYRAGQTHRLHDYLGNSFPLYCQLCHSIHFSSNCCCRDAGLAKHSGCMYTLTAVFLHCCSGPMFSHHLFLLQFLPLQYRAGKTQWLHDYLGNNLSKLPQWAKKAVADVAESKPDFRPVSGWTQVSQLHGPKVCLMNLCFFSTAAYSNIGNQISVTTASNFCQTL